MTTIEIYKKATGEVVETKKVSNLRSFMVYWAHQASNEYAWRIVGNE